MPSATRPLIEALFEFNPADAPGWSELSYKRLEEKFRSRFNGAREDVQPFSADFTIEPGGQVSQRSSILGKVRRLWSADKGELFQFSAATCAYNVLSSYTRFANHSPLMAELFGEYLGECAPTAIASVGQRYINKFLVPMDEPEAHKLFELYPCLPSAGGHRPFALQMVSETFDGGEVAVNLAFRGPELERAAYFLDIYARSTAAIEPTAAALVDWQARAHEPVRRAFNLALTSKGKEQWGAA